MVRWTFLVGAMLCAVYLISTLVSTRSGRPDWWDTWFYIGIELVPVALALARVRIDPRERFAWGTLAIGMLCVPIGDSLFSIFVEQQRSEVVLVCYGFYAAFFVLTLASIIMLLRRRLPAVRAAVWLDGLIAAFGLLAAGTLVVLKQLAGIATNPDEIIAAVFYPVGMLVLLAVLLGAATVLGRRPSRVWWFMTVAFGSMSIANAMVVQQIATGTLVRGSFVDAVWPPAMLLLALAAWSSGTPPRPTAAVPTTRALVAPTVSVLAALTILIIDVFSACPPVSVLLAFITLVLGVGRLVLAVADAVRSARHETELARSLQTARDAALAATEAKSQFLAMMSHELRTPLTAVIGMSELLLETELTTEQRGYAETIDRGGNLLLSVINNVLDFSKIESGHLQLEHRDFELAEALGGVVDLLGPSAVAKGLTVSFRIGPNCPTWLVGDANRLTQVLVNLTGNGLKFTRKGGVAISVDLREPVSTQGIVRLGVVVEDSGIGIRADRLDRLFRAFTQTDSSITRKFGGTGLGLVISRQIVEAMGGHIVVSSELGVGTTVEFDVMLSVAGPPEDRDALPVAAAAGPESSARGADPEDPLPLDWIPLRILLADDNSVNQQVGSMMISRLGHQVDTVGDGVAVLSALTRTSYDIILMDVHMPLLDGLEATTRIRLLESIRQPVIIALTASASAADRLACFEVGMDDYVTKPLRKTDLAKTLATWAKVAPEVRGSVLVPADDAG